MTRRRAAVLLATYNGEDYLAEFLESLVAQTFNDFTLFVRDDQSTDRTVSIVNDFANRLQIHIVASDRRLGPARSFVALMEAAGDGYDAYLFADQDDFWLDTKVDRAVKRLAATATEPVLYCSRLEYVDSKLRHLKLSRKPRIIAIQNALVENIVTGCTMAVNAPARRLLLTAPSDKMLMHDWWFYLVIVAVGAVAYDDFPSVKYRQHSANVVGAATSVLAVFRRRLRRFLAYSGASGYRISSQAKGLLESFGSMLSRDQYDLAGLLADRKTAANRLSLAFRSGLVRQTLADTLILRLLFLTGRY